MTYGVLCFRLEAVRRQSVRVVVMNNLLPSVVPMHQKFDLKGSTFKRKASKHERSKRFPTFKDLDFLEQHPDGILLETDTTGGIPAKNSKGERLLLFIGVIDILQSYRLLKKLEHTWKSMFHDKDTISVQRPSFYAERFQEFLAKKVFKKITSPLEVVLE
ncbi:hypothetical protein HPB52_014403 [Rhipicephalus sanguineus]|uniref:PIPK domain-containing protein n=1 Tax=Rhipicephalus sanguineus TaxID=34632 RepID=A0A9D4PRW8_RHISA|nr:hypothetical protein HPB52_014403 [Rhipicephalus sanguineus]